jgi:hypothetical protein
LIDGEQIEKAYKVIRDMFILQKANPSWKAR